MPSNWFYKFGNGVPEDLAIRVAENWNLLETRIPKTKMSYLSNRILVD